MYLVQRRHSPFRVVEALVFRFVSAPFEDVLVLLDRHAVGLVEPFVDGGVERPAQEITSTMYSGRSPLQVVESLY